MLADFNRAVLPTLHSWFNALCELQNLDEEQNDLRVSLLTVVNEVT